MKHPAKLLALILLLPVFFAQCKRETVIKTEYVAVHDTIIIPPASDTLTNFILIRHAETGTGSDPSLNTDGQARADELKRILAGTDIKTIYSTPYTRTLHTVTPLATSHNLDISEYEPTMPYPVLVQQFMDEGANKTSVICGHSNTLPEILKAFTDSTYIVDIPDTQYDNLFLISVSWHRKATVVRMKYGKATP